MKIVFFAHPEFISHQSMPRFARMLADGMRERGHDVEVRSPQQVFSKLSLPSVFYKWLGYIDQYIVFPNLIKKELRQWPADTLFVFTDHALGPWVPLVIDRPHVIHCHDFLAQYSALGAIPANKTSATGKLYQKYIYNGYKQGRNFISVSKKTKDDLAQFVTSPPKISEVVYNGLNPLFEPMPVVEARELLSKELTINLTEGYLLHVGGNQWYKNRKGIILLYTQWREKYSEQLPLILIGEKPDLDLEEVRNNSKYAADIHFVNGLGDGSVSRAYAAATVFLFPSLAEGFGWPIAEAMAAGTIVLTTGEAPMTEVAGDAAFLVDLMPQDHVGSLKWAEESANVLQKAVSLDNQARSEWVQKGIANTKRFNLNHSLNAIETIYTQVLNNEI
jgi:glycosyltransferase involved in cell wall biosynthesis